jgi:hypothetical protein
MAKTDISIVGGGDGGALGVAVARRPGFSRRFAIVQTTSRSDSVDRCFEVRLCEALLSFLEAFAPGAVVRLRGDGAPRQLSLGDYRAGDAPKMNAGAPARSALAPKAGTLLAWMETEPRRSVGGPLPSHGSDAYAVYTRAAQDGRVQEFPAARPDCSLPRFAPMPLIAPSTPASPPPSAWPRRFGGGGNA